MVNNGETQDRRSITNHTRKIVIIVAIVSAIMITLVTTGEAKKYTQSDVDDIIAHASAEVSVHVSESVSSSVSEEITEPAEPVPTTTVPATADSVLEDNFSVPDREYVDLKLGEYYTFENDGVSVTVNDIISEHDPDNGYRTILQVTYINDKDHPETLKSFLDWTVYDTDGEPLSSAVSTREDKFYRQKVEPGEELYGSISFENNGPGTYYAVYVGDDYSDENGVWKAKVK